MSFVYPCIVLTWPGENRRTRYRQDIDLHTEDQTFSMLCHRALVMGGSFDRPLYYSGKEYWGGGFRWRRWSFHWVLSIVGVRAGAFSSPGGYVIMTHFVFMFVPSQQKHFNAHYSHPFISVCPPGLIDSQIASVYSAPLVLVDNNIGPVHSILTEHSNRCMLIEAWHRRGYHPRGNNIQYLLFLFMVTCAVVLFALTPVSCKRSSETGA
jgi:hypothetical protein